MSGPGVTGCSRPIKHRLLYTEYGKGPNRFVELDANGKQVWEYQPPSITVIFHVLPNGNILFGYGGKPTGVGEITSRGETVFNYESKSSQVFGCERLPNGNTLVAEQGHARLLRSAPKGRLCTLLRCIPRTDGYHLEVRNVHQLSNGNILAAHEGEGAVREVDPNGKVCMGIHWRHQYRRSFATREWKYADSLRHQKRVIEVTPDKKIAWQFTAEDAPELNITWVV